MHRLFGRSSQPHKARGKFQSLGAVRDAELDWQGVLIRAERGSLRVDVIASDCLCVRFSPAEAFPLPRSYSVHKTDWAAPEFELEETSESLILKVAGGMLCLVNRGDSRLTFLTPHGTLVGGDAEPIAFRQGEFRLTRALSLRRAVTGWAHRPLSSICGASAIGFGRAPLSKTRPPTSPS